MSKRQHGCSVRTEEKAKIPRLLPLEKVTMSELCKHRIYPTIFYDWKKALFENAAAA